MKPSYVKDWTTLAGTTVEMRYQGTIVNHGYVDAVTPDGIILPEGFRGRLCPLGSSEADKQNRSYGECSGSALD